MLFWLEKSKSDQKQAGEKGQEQERQSKRDLALPLVLSNGAAQQVISIPKIFPAIELVEIDAYLFRFSH